MEQNKWYSEIPKEPRDRGYWVLYQLKRQGLTYQNVGERIGRTAAAVRQALFQPSFVVEKELADVLGVTPQQLFPERFDDEGKRLHIVRERSS